MEKLTAAIFDNLPELGEVHPQARAINLKDAPNMPIPLHAGAQAYFDAHKQD